MGKPQPLPSDIAAAVGCIQAWRADKQGHLKIPQEIWDTAVSLCQRHKKTKVAQAMGLDYGRLSQRCRQTAPGVAPPPASVALAEVHHQTSPTFVEMPASTNREVPNSAAVAATSVHLKHASGHQISVHGISQNGLTELMRAFWAAQ